MAEKVWVKVLRTAYEEDVVWSASKEYDADHPLVASTDLTPEEVGDAVSFLYQSGLIGRVDPVQLLGAQNPEIMDEIGSHEVVHIDEDPVAITPKGFEVMHERETNRTRHQTNFALVILTLGLFVASMIQAAVQLYSTSTAQAVSAGVLVVTIVVLVGIWRSDLSP